MSIVTYSITKATLAYKIYLVVNTLTENLARKENNITFFLFFQNRSSKEKEKEKLEKRVFMVLFNVIYNSIRD